MHDDAGYDGTAGTAGGRAFGTALRALADERELALDALADAAGLERTLVARLAAGEERAGIAVLARLAQALRLRPIAFLQQTGLLGLDVYASGLDPLYFLPDGQIRYDARIYMREINPRHPVPERDMTQRNPVLKALAADPLLDPLGKLEVELAYLLRAAVQATGGSL